MNTEHIANLSDTDVVFYVKKILSGNNKYGNFKTTDGQKFAYKLNSYEDESKLIVVLDTTSYIEDRDDLIDTSVFIFFSNLVFFIIIFVIFSGKVMMPFMENYRNQKAFITNAGHELKTPLAIISANNELCEMINGENEWTKSTKEQVERMTDLINRLVVLSRFEEKSNVIEKNINFLSNEQKELSQKIVTTDEILAKLAVQIESANDIFTSNSILKQSLHNLFDLVPDSITLEEVFMDKNSLIIRGITPTKDVFNQLLASPLRSIFTTSNTSFYQSKNGWYGFISTNKIDNSEGYNE